MLFIVFPLQIIMIKLLILLLRTQFNRPYMMPTFYHWICTCLLHVTLEQFDVLLLYVHAPLFQLKEIDVTGLKKLQLTKCSTFRVL